MTLADPYYEYPYSTQLAAAAATLGPLTIPGGWKSFTICVACTGISSTGGICNLTFNSAGANMAWTRLDGAAGAGTVTNANGTSAAVLSLTISQTAEFFAMVKVNNLIADQKVITTRVYSGGATAATVGVPSFGGGVYNLTSDLIISVKLAASANSLNANTAMWVYGTYGAT